MNAVGQFQQGIAAYDAGKYSRNVAQINARNAQSAGVMQRDKIRLASRIQIGRQINDQAGSGFAVGTGSAIDALRESAIARELDLMTSRVNATSQANAYTAQGNLDYAKGHAALVGGIISGATTLMEDAASAFTGMPPPSPKGGGGGNFDPAGVGSSTVDFNTVGY